MFDVRFDVGSQPCVVAYQDELPKYITPLAVFKIIPKVTA